MKVIPGSDATAVNTAAQPVKVASEDLGLRPYVIFIYYMKDLPPLQKQRLPIALYGHRTTKKVGDKVYVSESKGWIEKGAKLERKVIMFPAEVARDVRKVFKTQGARYYEIMVYAPREEFEKIRIFRGLLQDAWHLHVPAPAEELPHLIAERGLGVLRTGFEPVSWE